MQRFPLSSLSPTSLTLSIAGEQRLQGAIVLHIFAAFYFFTLLAVVCNDYFLPTVECICEDLKITPVSVLNSGSELKRRRSIKAL